MIKKLFMKNMQSHKDSKLFFHKNVNVIIGPSDAGKSAILRALRLALWNRPLGERFFRSYWAKNTDIGIDFNNGSIWREKGKENKYTLMPEKCVYDNDKTVFKAFKHDPPEEITQLHNLSSLNFQSQIDPFFLLQSSPGDVAKYLNKMAGLDDIDRVQANIDKRIRRLYQDKASAERNLEQLQTDLEAYQPLNEIGQLVEYADALEQELRVLREQKKHYKELIMQKLQKTRGKVESTQRHIDKLKPPVEQALKVKENIDKCKQQKRDIQERQKSIKHQRERIKKLQARVDSDKNKMEKYMPEICPFCGKEIEK